jgi:hypothetical protein
MSDEKEQSESDKTTTTRQSDDRGESISRIRYILTSDVVRNLVSIAAFIVSVISLSISIKQAEHTRELDQRTRSLEQLSVQLYAEVIGDAQATAEWPARDYSPFEPPYLTVPVRLFILNRTSLPQSIIGVWVSFDTDKPENQRPYVPIEGIEETDGSKVRWPKMIAPGAADGINLRVSIPIEAAMARRLGIDENKIKSHNMGTAKSLHFVLQEALDHQIPESLKRPVHFNLRLMSSSPGAPTNLPFIWSPTL